MADPMRSSSSSEKRKCCCPKGWRWPR